MFIERIESLLNQSLWRSLQLDGDGSLIYKGLLNNTLAFGIGSDGSYINENRTPASGVCSSASLIRCKQIGNTDKATLVEKRDSHIADNYRAKLLGAVALLTLANTAIKGRYISIEMHPQFGCDNKPHRPMPEKQPQADILRCLKTDPGLALQNQDVSCQGTCQPTSMSSCLF